MWVFSGPKKKMKTKILEALFPPFDRVSLASPGSQQTVGTMTTSFLYWLLPFLLSPDWCCFQRPLTMPFCLRIFKVENMPKSSLVRWHRLASAQNVWAFPSFFLSFLCSGKDRVWVINTPNPISLFIKKQTHPEFLSDTLLLKEGAKEEQE